MSEALIIRDDAALTVTWTATALEMKEAALAAAGLVGRVSNPDENETAVRVSIEVAYMLKQCESTRKACKEPVLEFGRRIDDAARAFAVDLQAEKNRIDRLLGDYQALEEAKRKAAEAARRLEEEKLRREQEAEERRVREEAAAITRRMNEEAERAVRAEREATSAKAKAEAAALQVEINRQVALAATDTHQQLEAIQERTNQAAAMLAPVPEAVRAEGQSVSEEIVIDQIDSWPLMQARPDLVSKVEFKLLEMKAALKSGIKLPGVKWHKETKSKVRAGRGPLMLTA